MNRKLRSIVPILSMAASVTALAQGTPPPAQSTPVVETSRISRFMAGAGDRPLGLLLRNGTFVTFSPGLAQQLPPSIDRGSLVRVSGNELVYNGSKTVEARSISIAGVAYQDTPGVPPPPVPPSPVPPPPSRPPTGERVGQPGAQMMAPPAPPRRGPRAMAVPPPPPAPCGLAAPQPPPPPPAAGAHAPVPPAPGATQP